MAKPAEAWHIPECGVDSADIRKLVLRNLIFALVSESLPHL
jgi:hypothetical protein